MKNKYIFLLPLIILCSHVFAEKADSLWKVINSKNSHDTSKINAYYELGWEYIYSNPDSAAIFGQKAFEITKGKKLKKFESKIYNLIGASFQIKGDFLNAIDNYQKTLLIGEELGDENTMLIAYGNIGSLYINLDRFNLALEYQLKSLELALKANKREKLGSIYNNLSLIYSDFNNHSKAVEYGLKSIEINTEFADKNALCSARGNLGTAYFNLKNYDKALENYKICFDLSVETENLYETGKVALDIGEVYFNLKKYDEAIKSYEKSIEISTKLGILENLRGAYFGLHKTYAEKKDNNNALKYLKLYVKILSEINKEELEKEVSQKIVEFNFNARSLRDSVKNAEETKYKDIIINAGKTQIEKDRILKMALTLGLLFFISFGLIIFNRFRITRKQKQIIEAKNKQTEEQKLIIEEKQKEILDSINYAKRIQDSLLDSFEAISKYFSDSFLLNKPKDIVSGDFYWLNKKVFNESGPNGISIVRELFFIAVCDSTGHGVPGGFMSLLNTAYLSEAINEKGIYQPNRIFDYVRSRLINTISKNQQRDGFDGVLMCFEKKIFYQNKELQKTETTLTYAAAHNAPVLIKNNELIRMGVDKMPVGHGAKSDNFSLFTCEIKPNDVLYVFTDGYPDQFGGPVSPKAGNNAKPRNFGMGKKFQYYRLEELLLKIAHLPMTEQKEILNNTFEEWKGSLEQVDDVCIIGLRL